VFYISVVFVRDNTRVSRAFLSREFSLEFLFRRSFFQNGSPAVFSRTSLEGKKNETLRAIASHFITRAIVSFTKEYTRETQQRTTRGIY